MKPNICPALHCSDAKPALRAVHCALCSPRVDSSPGSVSAPSPLAEVSQVQWPITASTGRNAATFSNWSFDNPSFDNSTRPLQPRWPPDQGCRAGPSARLCAEAPASDQDRRFQAGRWLRLARRLPQTAHAAKPRSISSAAPAAPAMSSRSMPAGCAAERAGPDAEVQSEQRALAHRGALTKAPGWSTTLSRTPQPCVRLPESPIAIPTKTKKNRLKGGLGGVGVFRKAIIFNANLHTPALYPLPTHKRNYAWFGIEVDRVSLRSHPSHCSDTGLVHEMRSPFKMARSARPCLSWGIWCKHGPWPVNP